MNENHSRSNSIARNSIHERSISRRSIVSGKGIIQNDLTSEGSISRQSNIDDALNRSDICGPNERSFSRRSNNHTLGRAINIADHENSLSRRSHVHQGTNLDSGQRSSRTSASRQRHSSTSADANPSKKRKRSKKNKKSSSDKPGVFRKILYLLKSFRAILSDLNYLKISLVHKVEILFAKWGIICFRYPYYVLGASVLLFIFGSCGFLASPVWVDGSEELYSLPLTQARRDQQIFNNLFGQYLSRATYVNITGDSEESILTFEHMYYVEQLETIIRGILPDSEGKYWSVGPTAYVESSDGKYTYEDFENSSKTYWDTKDKLGLPDGRCLARQHGINLQCLCLKNASNGKCSVQSIIEMGITSNTKYTAWKQRADAARQLGQPLPKPGVNDTFELIKIGDFVFSPEGQGFVPGLTLGGIRQAPCTRKLSRVLMSKIQPEMYSEKGSAEVEVHAECISHIESFQFIYLLEDNEHNYHANMLLEEIIIQRINKFREKWSNEWGLRVLQNPMRARDDELRKATSESSDILFVFMTFAILVVYSVGVNFNIDIFKAKVYTALAGVGAAILGMIAGIGFICYLGIELVPTALIVPFLSMGIGVDDMFVIINSYSLSYPLKDPQKRVEKTMADSGLGITITTLTNLIAFSIGSFSPYMSIKNFCLFSAGALFFGYIFVLTVTVSILSLEAYREAQLSTCCCFPINELKNYEEEDKHMQTLTPNFAPSDAPDNVVKRRVHRAFVEDPYWRAKVMKRGVRVTGPSPTVQDERSTDLWSNTAWQTITRPAERLALITETSENNIDGTSVDDYAHSVTPRGSHRNAFGSTGGPEIFNLGDTYLEPQTEIIPVSAEQPTPEDAYDDTYGRIFNSAKEPQFADEAHHQSRPPSPLTDRDDVRVHSGLSGIHHRLPLTMSSININNRFSEGMSTGRASRLTGDGISSRRAMSVSTDYNPQEWADIKYTILSEPKGNVGRGMREFLMRQYALVLLRPWVKATVIVIFVTFACVSTYGLLNVEQGLDLQDLSPDTSYLKEFDDLQKKYFTDFDVPTSLFFDKDIPWHEKHIQDSLAKFMTEMGKMDSIALVVDPLTRILNDREIFSENNRYDEDYFNSAIKSALNGVYAQFFSDFLFEGNKVSSWKATIFPRAMFTSSERATFMIETRKLLDTWMVDPDAIIFDEVCETNESMCIARNDENFLSPIRLQSDDGQLMDPTSPLTAYAWNYMMIFYESDLGITSAVVVSMACAVVAMLFVTILLLTELTMGMIVVLMLFLIDLNLFGFMYYWDVKLNMISMINLVISVGFAVDYAAHMCHSYSHCTSKSPDMKATEMLVLMGAAVFNGASSTLIGILMLGFSSSYIFRVFFKLFLLVVVFGVSHGMVLLPVVLTIVDDLTAKHKEKLKQLASSSKSERKSQLSITNKTETNGPP